MTDIEIIQPSVTATRSPAVSPGNPSSLVSGSGKASSIPDPQPRMSSSPLQRTDQSSISSPSSPVTPSSSAPTAPVNKAIAWTFKTNGAITSCPAIGADGTVYVTSEDKKLYALSLDGKKKWEYETEALIDSSPVVNQSEQLLVANGEGHLYMVNGGIVIAWKFSVGGSAFSATPAISPDSSIYLGNWYNRFYGLTAMGKNKWVTTDKNNIVFQETDPLNLGNSIYSSAALTPDGKTMYVGDEGNVLHAIEEKILNVGYFGTNRSLEPAMKWNFYGQGKFTSSPAIGTDGSIYVGNTDQNLYAINPDKSQKWAFKTEGPITSSPVIDEKGIVYIGSEDGKLYAINPDGKQKWTYDMKGPVIGTPALGADGTIVVSAASTPGTLQILQRDNPQAATTVMVTLNGKVRSSPAIGDGMIYIGDDQGLLTAIKRDKIRLAETPWPKFHADRQNSGLAPSPAPGGR